MLAKSRDDSSLRNVDSENISEFISDNVPSNDDLISSDSIDSDRDDVDDERSDTASEYGVLVHAAREVLIYS